MPGIAQVRDGIRSRALSAFVAVAVALGAAGAVAGAVVVTRSGGDGRAGNLERFAALTFGAAGGRAALSALTAPVEDEEEEGEAEEAAAELPELPETPLTFSEYRTPNGWALRPAGRQLDISRAPTGLAVSPDHKTVVVVSSGIFTEDMTIVDASTLAATPYPSADLYMGAAIADGRVWVSTGSRNRVYEYQLVGPAAVGLRQGTPLIPQGQANNGIPVIGYPGNMVRRSDGRLYVAGNLSVPESFIAGKQAGADCADSTICSVINVIDTSGSFSPSTPAVRYIPVGRDAFGVALNEAKGKLYVTNWADETNPARTPGPGQKATGTVSVVDLATEREVEVVPVGHHPTGTVLSPDGGTLFVANSADDTLSALKIHPVTGAITATKTIDVRTTPDSPKAATPLALGFTADGAYLLVGLAGQNAIEVREPDGDAIPRTIEVELAQGQTAMLDVPHTYIPTGWYPSALASAPHPDDPDEARLYVTNLKGIGAGPGGNFQAQPFSGIRTQGTLQVVDVPTSPALRESQLDEWTAQVVENNKWAVIFNQELQGAAENPCTPAPLPQGGSTLSQLLCDQSTASGPSPYHVVYLVKENKTFDQFFGDIKATLLDADADPTFLLYGEAVTTNQHNLARLFTLGDAFWADSEQSTTGHSWTSAGYATEFNEITWNPQYSQGFRGNRWAGQYEGQTSGPRDPEIAEQEGELFDPEERLVDLMADPKTNPRDATFRIYSDDVNEGSPAVQWRVPMSVWGLGPDAVHHSRDLDFPDTDRAEVFINGRTISHAWSLDRHGQPPPSFGKEIGLCGAPDDPNVSNAEGSFCAAGTSPTDYEDFAVRAWTDKYNACIATGTDAQCQPAMPNFIYMALPVDHTLGFNPLAPTPASMVADNDHAVGLIVDTLSKSPFWKNTLILATEDDTQLAGDHVDSHRTFLLAVGGLARRYGPQGKVSHQPGSLPSILKTVEVLFGINRPLTIYDRAAVPLHDFIVPTLADVNDTQYTAVKPPVPFLRNPPSGDLATLSLMLDWRIDRTEPGLLTALFYYGEKGWALPERYKKLLEKARERG